MNSCLTTAAPQPYEASQRWEVAYREVLLSSPPSAAPRDLQSFKESAQEAGHSGATPPLPLCPKVHSILVRPEWESQQPLLRERTCRQLSVP
jgi:hypothetical protein